MTRKLYLILSFILNLFSLAAGFIVAIFYLVYRLLFPRKQGSHPVSKFFRKAFEHEKTKNSLEIVLLAIILAINFCLYRPSTDVQAKQITLEAPENIVITESTYQKPVNGYLSQTYHWYHQAIDIAAELNANVYPIAEGKVISIEYKKWGYGHSLVIENDNGYKSLYAHLGEIKVKQGQKVDKNTILADIGMTGWTTGPHLHLEIYENEKTINPLEVLPDF